MEKIKKKIPRNFVKKVDYEHYTELYDMFGFQSQYSVDKYGNERYSNISRRIRVNIQISIDINSDEDLKFVNDLQNKGLEFVADQGFNLEKFKFIMNQGYTNLPILLKHSDQEISEMAWILSKYFSQREMIMPDKIVD